MVVVQEIVDLRTVEVAWWVHGITPSSPSVFPWNSSIVVPDVIHIIHFSILLELGQPLLSIRTSLWFLSGGYSSLISLANHVLLLSVLSVKDLRVLSPGDVEGSS